MKKFLLPLVAFLAIGSGANADQPAIMAGMTCPITDTTIVVISAPAEYVENLTVENGSSNDPFHVGWRSVGHDQGNLIEVFCSLERINVNIRGFGRAIVRIHVPHGTEVLRRY